MPTTARIKLTGVLARSGRRGRIRFLVCDRGRAWKQAVFPPEPCGDPCWLPVDDAVFAMAVALLAAGPGAEGRVATAELELRPGCCDHEALVDDVLALWLEAPAASAGA